MSERLKEFREFREKMNERILAAKNLNINRFFTLDGRAYEEGKLDALTKEFAGLSASMVLRCDDCIAYHVIRCKELGAGEAHILPTQIIGQDEDDVGLGVGGKNRPSQQRGDQKHHETFHVHSSLSKKRLLSDIAD